MTATNLLSVLTLFCTYIVAEPVYGLESSDSFGAGSGPIWLDDVKCTGTESNILSCPQLALGSDHNCQHNEDSGIKCQSKQSEYVFFACLFIYLLVCLYICFSPF